MKCLLLVLCRLDTRTTEVMEKCLEDSLGDEGYAAWLQYREIQRFKRDREASSKWEATDSTTGEEGKGATGKPSPWFLVPDQGNAYAHYSGMRVC